MKKKIIALCLVFCLLIFVGFFGLQYLTGHSRVLESNWGISLPYKAVCRQVYEKDSGASFHGDGIRYHVFSYKYEDYIDLMFAWPPNHKTDTAAAESRLNAIEVETEERPDYAACSSWGKSREDGSEILFFWNPEINRLYVIEAFF